MDTLKKNLEQREKPELIAVIQHMLRQEPFRVQVACLRKRDSRRSAEKGSHHEGECSQLVFASQQL